MLLRSPRNVVLGTVLLIPIIASAAPAEKIIYSFTGRADGSAPDATLLNVNGTLYGTASGAGETSGSVFAVTPAGTETTLATFAGGVDGDFPSSHLVISSNQLLGTSTGGGGTGCFGHGCGTVFTVPLSGGGSSQLYAFQGSPDGSEPVGGLVELHGNFYGVTFGGGNPACYAENGCGTVFKITPSGVETTLHVFGGSGDGANPSGRLISYGGELYGVTQNGGASNFGTIFKISPKGTETVLYSFTDGTDGAYPSGALLAKNGALYGAVPCVCNSSPYYGSIFKFITTLQTIYTFKGGSDGIGPTGDLLEMNGNLYGLTAFGGGGPCNNGCGTIFEVSAAGKERVLHAFTGAPDGGFPQGGLVNLKGILYGVTYNGGTGLLPIGTVFSLQR